jgi:hypothetical protein
MTAVRTQIGSDYHVIQSALSAYADEAYTSAKKLTGTGIVGTNPQIDPSTETYIGQMRWNKPLIAAVNVASLTDSANGSTTNVDTDFLTYIKTVRTHGHSKINMGQLVSGQDSLARVARDFGETRSQDEHNALLQVLRGVGISEILRGAKTGGTGGQSWTSSTSDAGKGFYVDVGGPLITLTGKDASGTANAAYVGAARAEKFLEAIGMAWKDHEPEYAYLVTSPKVMASLRSANLIDAAGVEDGNVNFNTIFNGKLRLIQTRASQGFSAAEITKINTGGGTDITAASEVSYIVLPGAIAMAPLDVPDSVEIGRDAAAYKGGGTTSIWYRWGYVLAPSGYDWAGSTSAFPSDADYSSVFETTGGTTTKKLLSAITAADDTVGSWSRKATSTLNLGILPVIHT